MCFLRPLSLLKCLNFFSWFPWVTFILTLRCYRNFIIDSFITLRTIIQDLTSGLEHVCGMNHVEKDKSTPKDPL